MLIQVTFCDKMFLMRYFVLLALSFFSFAYSQEKPTALVSIAPYKYFVERIADGTVKVDLIVPTGVSEHTFEPTARALVNASKASVWFRMGEPFEDRVLQSIQRYNPHMRIFDLRDEVDLIIPEEHAGCIHASCEDPHIWLSPKEAIKQAKTVYNGLSETFPANREIYHKNFIAFKDDLEKLDRTIDELLKPVKIKTIMVSHPAYAYLARDYGLKQLSIEFEGREPSPKQLTQVLQTARNLGIKKVFVQPQHIGKGARLVARELNAQVIEINPLAENYMENLANIAKSIAAP